MSKGISSAEVNAYRLKNGVSLSEAVIALKEEEQRLNILKLKKNCKQARSLEEVKLVMREMLDLFKVEQVGLQNEVSTCEHCGSQVEIIDRYKAGKKEQFNYKLCTPCDTCKHNETENDTLFPCSYCSYMYDA